MVVLKNIFAESNFNFQSFYFLQKKQRLELFLKMEAANAAKYQETDVISSTVHDEAAIAVASITSQNNEEVITPDYSSVSDLSLIMSSAWSMSIFLVFSKIIINF